MNKRPLLLAVIVTVVLCVIVFLFANKNENDVKATVIKGQIANELVEFRKELPIEIHGDSVVLTDARLEDSVLAFTYETNKDNYENYKDLKDFISSDVNLARFFSGINEELEQAITDAHLNIKLELVNSENNMERFSIFVKNERFIEIIKNMESGSLNGNSILQTYATLIKLQKKQLPIQLDEYSSLTDIDIKGSTIVYVYKIKGNPDLSGMDEEGLKKETVEEFIKLFKDVDNYKIKLRKEKVGIRFIYKNEAGKEIHLMDITTDDLLSL